MSEEGTPKTRALVVGVDGSESSVAALKYAARLAKALGSTVTTVTSWRYPMGYDTYIPLEWSPESDAEQIIAEAVTAAFGTEPPEGLQSVIRQGQPASVLIEESADAELLIVGSRGLGGFTGLLVGSVSAACVAHATCPVLVFRHEPSKA